MGIIRKRKSWRFIEWALLGGLITLTAEFEDIGVGEWLDMRLFFFLGGLIHDIASIEIDQPGSLTLLWLILPILLALRLLLVHKRLLFYQFSWRDVPIRYGQTITPRSHLLRTHLWGSLECWEKIWVKEKVLIEGRQGNALCCGVRAGCEFSQVDGCDRSP